MGLLRDGSGQVEDIVAKLRDREQERTRENAEDLAKKQHFYETLTADMRRA